MVMSYCRTIPSNAASCSKKPRTSLHSMEHSNGGRSHQYPNYPSSTHGPAHQGTEGRDPSTQYQPSSTHGPAHQGRDPSTQYQPSSTHGPAHQGRDPSTQYQPSLQTNHDANYYSSNNDPQREDDQYSEPTHTTEQVCGSYHMKQPNPSKYSKLKETAQIEEKQYSEYKARKKERIVEQLSCLEPQKVGGQGQSVDDIRKKQEQGLRRAKIQKKIDREDKQKHTKQLEQEKLDEYKQQQREKAVQLERHKQQERNVDLDYLRRKRLEKFDSR